MSRAPSPETLAQVELENRRGEALMAAEAARLGLGEAKPPPPEYSGWQEEILELRRTYLEPGAADWYAGMSQPDQLLLVWMCRDVSHHAGELRRRLSRPYRLRCAAAGVPLAPLREVEEALWDLADDAVTAWGIDLERNCVEVTTDGDVAALAAELRGRFGDLVTVEFGHAAQI